MILYYIILYRSILYGVLSLASRRGQDKQLLPVCIYIYICIYVYLSLSLSIYLSISISLSIYLQKGRESHTFCRYCLKCAHFATHTTHAASLVHTFCHEKLIMGNCGTSVMTPFFLTRLEAVK